MALLKGIDVIRRWVIKTRLKEQAKEGGVAITLPKKEFVDLNTSITADRLLRSGVDIDQLTSPNQVENLINQINKRSVISQGDPRFKGIMEQLMGKKGEVFDLEGKKIKDTSKIMAGKEIKFDDIPPGSRGGADDIAAPVQSAEEATTNLADSTVMKITSMEPVAALKEANKVIKREGIYKALSKEQASKILKDSEDWIFQRDPDDLYDYKKKRPFRDDPDFDPDDPDRNNFKGGGITRIGFKDGMTRRTFLKILSGAISIPIVGKFFKPAKIGKTVTKVPMIKTGDVPGKPEWFDSLVNKVILEGDDVTKNFATKDREIVHMKKIDDETSVTVTRDLDNDSIIVDIDDPVRNVMGESGDTNLMMRYKKGRADEETKGTPPDEFDVTEADMRNYMDGPDDYVTEFTENTVQNTKDLTSDLTS